MPKELPTTTEDSQPEETTLDDLRISYEAFNAARTAEMKTGKYPHRVDSKRYTQIQKCLNDRLNGGKFDYNIYLSCAGCKNCEQKVDQPLDVKINQTETRLVKNLEQQKKVYLKNVEIDLNVDNANVKKLNNEIKRLNFELEKMSNELQKLTEERHMLTNELLLMKSEDQRKYDESSKEDENMATKEDENMTSNEDEEEIDILDLQMKTMADLNKDNDIYDNE